MVDRLRWRLTAFLAAVTGAVLLAMTLVSLFLLERDSVALTRENFTAYFSSLTAYVAQEDQLSLDYVNQSADTGRFYLQIYDRGRPLFSARLPGRGQELEATFAQALQQAGPEDLGRIGSATIHLPGPHGGFFAGVAQIQKGKGQLTLVALHPLEQFQASIWQTRGKVALVVAAALAVLTAFAWVYTGRMLRPIQENQRQQQAFVAAASHELRTPLAAILSAASAMEQAEPVQRSQFAHMIAREGSRMSRLIGELLSLASLQSGARLHLEPVEMDMLLLECYEANLPLAKEQGLNLTLSLYDQEIPTMNLDRDKMAQVLSILVSNAREHTPAPGKIDLELTVGKKHLRLAVSDTGPGVPEGEREAIFRRFYRTESARSSRDHFGLGLSIAWQIVQEHRGRLYVRPAPGGGAEFVMELPLD